MKHAWKSLKALLASDLEDESDEPTPKGAAKKSPDKKEESDGEEESDEEEKDDKDKKSGSTQKKEAGKDDDKQADAVGSVRLALDDYNGLLAMATSAKEAKAENKVLKGKADKWDAYQAALAGGKPGADSAGAEAAVEVEEGKDPYAGLRQKYPKLMEDC
ncbi:hypothetical protein CLV98_1622 [Dyadobacter jejuensis]|uniref:Uncharacterized protein n=1 Tax=Dyadobacter jejuensis TaxID=1082580 RepID=A0A315ZRJ6_9BACT|nr:hypothetical protein [Dyadobacter jejuensis]PWJ47630.1 hypothetical protein CLV98_1622 [Dyadobacter jejuensis]